MVISWTKGLFEREAPYCNIMDTGGSVTVSKFLRYSHLLLIRCKGEPPNPLERIVEHIEERKQDYGKFIQVNTSNKSPQEVVQKLMALFNKNVQQK